MTGIVRCPKGSAKCPGCGKVRRVYKDEQGWRCHAHHGDPRCYDPFRHPRIPDEHVIDDLNP